MKENIQKFKSTYYLFTILVLVFFLYVYLLTILWNTGLRFDMTQVLAPAFGVLFYFTGVLVQKAKRNYFIGIRTPWTLSSEKVWDRTHAIGGKLFKAAGILALLGVFFPRYAILFLLIPVLSVALFAVIYSYFIYQKEKVA